MNRRRTSGSTTATLALLLLILLAAGAWNYRRNVQHERTSQRGRPYASYSVGEVRLLREAAGAELATARARFDRARGGRAGSARDLGSVGSNVGQFDRTTRASRAIREAAADVAEHEKLTAALDEELAARATLGSGWSLHLKRLTTY